MTGGPTGSEQPWRAGNGCVIVRVRLTPKSSIEAVDGVAPSAEGAALAARVRAVPAEGEANAAVEKLIARWLDVPKSTVRVTAGAKSRIKSLTISGETDCLEQRLRAKLAPI
jgi:uncharacterized protein YggU (UPF0235/DUF167 family)